MRISELIEYLKSFEKSFGDVCVEGNRQLTLTNDDFVFIDGNDNVCSRDGLIRFASRTKVCSVRIHQED